MLEIVDSDAGVTSDAAAELIAGYATYTTASSIEASRPAVAPDNSPLACFCTATVLPAELREYAAN